MKNNAKLGYKMSKQMFDSLALAIKAKKKGNIYQAVMDYINEEFGLRGTVTQLSIVG